MEDAAMTHSTINNAKKTSFQLEEINDYQETRNNINNHNNHNYNNNNSTIRKTNKNSLKQFSVELKDFDSSLATNNSFNYNNTNKNIEDIGGVIESKIVMSNKSQNNSSSNIGTPGPIRAANSIITVSEVNNLKQSNKNLVDSSNVSNNTNMTELSKTGTDDASKPVKKPIRVTSRIVFLKVGQIDTRNERYDAEAYIEASWEDEKIYRILADPNMTKNSMLFLNFQNQYYFFF